MELSVGQQEVSGVITYGRGDASVVLVLTTVVHAKPQGTEDLMISRRVYMHASDLCSFPFEMLFTMII